MPTGGRTYTYYKYVVVIGSVWSVLLVLHNYCVIISECQKLMAPSKNRDFGPPPLVLDRYLLVEWILRSQVVIFRDHLDTYGQLASRDVQ